MTTTAATTSPAVRGSLSDLHLVRDDPHPPAKVWRALTDPELIMLWAWKIKPEGFSTTVGAKFKLAPASRSSTSASPASAASSSPSW